ncbi:hypothetical protein [[Eubacterium] cellulosolvens]
MPEFANETIPLPFTMIDATREEVLAADITLVSQKISGFARCGGHLCTCLAPHVFTTLSLGGKVGELWHTPTQQTRRGKLSGLAASLFLLPVRC